MLKLEILSWMIMLVNLLWEWNNLCDLKFLGCKLGVIQSSVFKICNTNMVYLTKITGFIRMFNDLIQI